MDPVCANSYVVSKGNNDTARRLDSNIEFTKFYFGLFVSVDLFCVLAFIFMKRKYERTRVRPTLLVILCVLGSLFQMFYGSLQVLVNKSYPCWLTVIFPIMIIPFSGASIIGRLVLLLYLSRFSEASILAMASSDFGFRRVSQHSSDDMIWQSKTKVLPVFVTAVRLLVSKPKPEQSPQEILETLTHLHFLTSRTGMMLLTIGGILPFLMVSLVLLATDPVYTRCYNCTISSSMVVAIIAVGVVVLGVGFFVWWRTRRLRDAWGLANEAFFSLVFGIVGLVGFLLTTFADRGVFTTYSHMFQLSLGFCLIVVEQTLVQLYLGARTARQAQRAIESPQSELSLDIILRDMDMTREFEKHLAHEFGLESLLFLRDAETWKRNFFDISESARKARARIICKTYIQWQGLYSINIPSKMMEAINNAVNIDLAPVELTLFDDAVEEVTKLLNTGAVMRFAERIKTIRKSNLTSKSFPASARKSDLSSSLPAIARKSDMSSVTFPAIARKSDLTSIGFPTKFSSIDHHM